MMTQDELREALLEALLDYETLKRTRRLKAVKKALQGTMVATVIGSTGIMAAGQGSRSNQVRETASIVASVPNAMATVATLLPESSYLKPIPGVAHFAFDSYVLAPDQEERLMELIKQMPKDAEITVIGRTDSQGKRSYNKRLGELRAQAVADYFAYHGLKIKTVGSKVSEEVRFSWMARRVDILVDSKPFFLNLSPLEKQVSLLQPKTKAQTSMIALPYQDKGVRVKPLQEIEKPAPISNTKSAEAKSDVGIAVAKPKPGAERPETYRQQVRGIAHFAKDSHRLASAHKERLIELITQLPKEAEITVIGRTDASGGDDYNENLGMQRAKAVANFLANQGIKIKAVGSKVSSEVDTGWMARRVDIVVDSTKAPVTINLPPPLIQDIDHRVKVNPGPQIHLNTPAIGKKPTAQVSPPTSVKDKKVSAIGKETSRLIQRARNSHNSRQTEQTFEANPGLWGNGAKVNNACLDKAGSVRESLNCFPK